MIKGNLHSVESLGTLDGPGLRYVLFTQGCVLRCLFCHNPDTWKTRGAARVVTAEEMVEEIRPYIPYFKASGGGVTVSGGEPLLQLPFLIELFKLLKGSIHASILQQDVQMIRKLSWKAWRRSSNTLTSCSST